MEQVLKRLLKRECANTSFSFVLSIPGWLQLTCWRLLITSLANFALYHVSLTLVPPSADSVFFSEFSRVVVDILIDVLTVFSTK